MATYTAYSKRHLATSASPSVDIATRSSIFNYTIPVYLGMRLQKTTKKILINLENPNLTKMESITDNKSDFINKCCAYIMSQPETWVKEFIQRQVRVCN